jgi:hypothetical protein
MSDEAGEMGTALRETIKAVVNGKGARLWHELQV